MGEGSGGEGGGNWGERGRELGMGYPLSTPSHLSQNIVNRKGCYLNDLKFFIMVAYTIFQAHVTYCKLPSLLDFRWPTETTEPLSTLSNPAVGETVLTPVKCCCNTGEMPIRLHIFYVHFTLAHM